jgi:hypothetical protein
VTMEAPVSLNIALDYDETYTADPELWNYFINMATVRGHKVWCVTARRDTEENREIVCIPGLPRYRHKFTSHSAKEWFMAEQGIKIDIWVDDNVRAITEGV